MSFRLFTIVLLLALSWPASAWANMAAPYRPGAIGAEPEGIDGVRVVHEDLVFDLRNEEGGRALNDRVVAKYELHNDGAARTLDLQFVAVGMTRGAPFAVEVNGEPVERRFDPEHPIPSSWTYPEKTPVPRGGSTWLAAAKPQENVAPSIVFTAELQAGANEIEVSYELKPSETTDGQGWVHQTAYVLSPARNWADFGTLHIKVILPDDIDVATSLELDRADGVLQGEFDGLPADTLTITTRPEVPFGNLVLYHLLTTGGAMLIAWMGSFFGVRRLFTTTDAATKAALAGAAATVVAIPIGVVALWLFEALLPPAAPDRGYALLFLGTPAVIALAVFGGGGVTGWLWWRGTSSS